MLLKRYCMISMLLFLWVEINFGQVVASHDTIFCIGNNFEEIKNNRGCKFLNKDDQSYKFHFKLDRMVIPEEVILYPVDENNHFENVETCGSGYMLWGGVIYANQSCTSYFGMYTIHADSFYNLPWIFAGELYTFPDCDSLLTRVVFKYDKPKQHPSGVIRNALWTYKPSEYYGEDVIWKVYVVKDTVLDNKDYSIITIDKGNGPIPESFVPVCIEDDTWYFYEEGKTKPFFGKKLVGSDSSSIQYYLPQVSPLYDITTPMGITNVDTSMYSSKINNYSDGFWLSDGLPYIYRDYIPMANHGHYYRGMLSPKISSNGFFGAFRDVEPSELNGMLLSYTNEQFVYHHTDIECGFISKIKNVDLYQEINIYPNPTPSSFYLEPSDLVDHISIYNVQGKRMVQLKPSSSSIDVHDLENGLYFITLILKDKTIVERKLVVYK